MRLAVISDIHGNLTALNTALEDLQVAGGADKLWVLGDHAAMGPHPAECVRRLQDLIDVWGEKNIGFISGNTDRYLVRGIRPASKPAENQEDLVKLVSFRRRWAARMEWTLEQLSFSDYEWLTKLRHELDLEVPGYGFVLGYHGTPGEDEGYLFPSTPLEEADDAMLDREGHLGIGGHIHQQMDRQLTRWRVINVGSVGLSFEMPTKAQYGIFTFEGDDVQVDLRAIPYDVEAVIADLAARNHPDVDGMARVLREGN